MTCYFPPRVESTLEDKVIWILTLVTWQEQLMSCVFWQHVAPLISSPERGKKKNAPARQGPKSSLFLLVHALMVVNIISSILIEICAAKIRASDLHVLRRM